MALANIAPVLMKWLGAGDASVAVAEKAVGIAQTITGTGTPEEALAVLRADAAKAHEYRMAVEAREAELEQAYLRDRQDARNRDVQIVQAKGRNLRGDVLAYAAVATLGVVIILLFVMKVPQESREILLVVLGALVKIVGDVFAFEFGSSKDSQRNQQAVADMLKQS